MLGALVVRFFLGGAIVSVFAATGELFEPKTFAGLFGAAPTVALVSLSLGYARHDTDYVGTLARSMMIGAMGFYVYGVACVAVAKRPNLPVSVGAIAAWGTWLAFSFPSLPTCMRQPPRST